MSAVLRMRAGNLDECFLVEVQGKFELTPQHIRENGDDRKGVEIGSLTVAEDRKTASIHMGGNTLTGKLETLKKPFLVVKKTGRKEAVLQGAPPSDGGAASSVGSAASPEGAASVAVSATGQELWSSVLEVQAVIRRKAVFTKRPSIHVPPSLVRKPVVSKKKKR